MSSQDLAQKLINRYGMEALQNFSDIILDRDGTINAPCPPVSGTANTGYVTKPEEFKLLPYVGEGLRALDEQGLSLHVFTQQKSVGKGVITLDELKEIHRTMRDILMAEEFMVHLGEVRYCPHVESDNCDCMKQKPSSGKQPKMILDIMDSQNLYPNEIMVIGDSDRDVPSKELMEQGMMFVAVPNPEASSGREGKLSKETWENMVDPTGKNYICTENLLELAEALQHLHKSES